MGYWKEKFESRYLDCYAIKVVVGWIGSGATFVVGKFLGLVASGNWSLVTSPDAETYDCRRKVLALWNPSLGWKERVGVGGPKVFEKTAPWGCALFALHPRLVWGGPLALSIGLRGRGGAENFEWRVLNCEWEAAGWASAVAWGEV
jgi:hypothetical protein